VYALDLAERDTQEDPARRFGRFVTFDYDEVTGFDRLLYSSSNSGRAVRLLDGWHASPCR